MVSKQEEQLAVMNEELSEVISSKVFNFKVPPTLVSIDVGYGDVKITVNGEKIIFPAKVGVNNQLEQLGGVSSLSSQDIFVKLDNNIYAVGTSAISSEEVKTKNEKRFGFEEIGMNVILAVALRMALGKSGGNVVLSTGVPLSFFKEQEIEFKDFLLSEEFHKTINEVDLINGFTENGVKYSKADCGEITVVEAVISPQGISGIVPTLLKEMEDGSRVPRFPEEMGADTEVAIVDIGMKTTDVAVVELLGEGVAYKLIWNSTFTLPNEGYDSFLNNMKARIMLKTQAKTITEKELLRTVKRGFLKFEGTRYDFKEDIVTAKKETSRKIVEKIKELWDEELKYIDLIFLIGGGGIFFGEYVKESFAKQGAVITEIEKTDDNELPFDSQFANAEGYDMYGWIALLQYCEKNNIKMPS